MERCLVMKEEKVTNNILNWLESNGWKIICYDFPQSGTGILLHPNSIENRTTKNKGGVIPDIIATRNSIALFFENKDRYVSSDFDKIKDIKKLGNYSDSIDNILFEFAVSTVYFGIGIPSIEKYIKKSIKNIEGIDFLISTNENGEVQIHFDRNAILP